MTARKQPPAQTASVVELPKRLAGTEAIVAEVQAGTKAQEREISAMLQQLAEASRVRHLARAQELVPIGVRLQRPDLDDLIEIGKRMLKVRSQL